MGLVATTQDRLAAADAEELAALFASTFPGTDSALERFRFLLQHAPNASYSLVRNGRGTVIAGLITFRRTLDYHGVSLNACGMSYMAAEKDHQNFSATDILKTALFGITAAADLTIGIARKAMDRYWYPYGFTGFTNFAELSVNLNEAPTDVGAYALREANEGDINWMAELYQQTYSGTIGPLRRDESLWRYYFRKAATHGMALRKLLLGGTPVAYICEAGGVIHETAFCPDHVAGLLGVLKATARAAAQPPVARLQVGLAHPLVKWCRRFEHSQSTRFVWKGGHIARLEALDRVLQKIRPVLQARCKNIGLEEFKLELSNQTLSYARGSMDITPNPAASGRPIGMRDWCSLVLGVLDPRDMTALSAHPQLDLIRLLFPQQHPQVPLLDQF